VYGSNKREVIANPSLIQSGVMVTRASHERQTGWT
jgi:hypothetical protein